MKARDLQKLSDEFNKCYRVVHESLYGEDAGTEDQFDRLRRVHDLYQMTAAFPVWPFNFGSIRLFGTVATSPLVLLGVIIPLEIYVF